MVVHPNIGKPDTLHRLRGSSHGHAGAYGNQSACSGATHGCQSPRRRTRGNAYSYDSTHSYQQD